MHQLMQTRQRRAAVAAPARSRVTSRPNRHSHPLAARWVVSRDSGLTMCWVSIGR
jgi:hypothetical protein